MYKNHYKSTINSNRVTIEVRYLKNLLGEYKNILKVNIQFKVSISNFGDCFSLIK